MYNITGMLTMYTESTQSNISIITLLEGGGGVVCWQISIIVIFFTELNKLLPTELTGHAIHIFFTVKT